MSQYHYEAKKMYGGQVMVRDYNLNECFRGGHDLVVLYKTYRMTVPHGELKARAVKVDQKRYRSKFDGREYGVYFFRWVEDKELKDNGEN